jgi:hypothetical protein
VGPVDHEGGEAGLLRLNALAGSAEHEAGHDHAVTVERWGPRLPAAPSAISSIDTDNP